MAGEGVNMVPDLDHLLPHSDTITVTQARSKSHIKGRPFHNYLVLHLYSYDYHLHWFLLSLFSQYKIRYTCFISVTWVLLGSHPDLVHTFFLNNVYVIFINVNVTWPILKIFLKSFRTSIGNSPTVNQHLPHCQQRPPHPNWQAPAANPKESWTLTPVPLVLHSSLTLIGNFTTLLLHLIQLNPPPYHHRFCL